MLTSTSNHNEVSETRCTLHLKQLENWKKYIKQLCSDTGQQATQGCDPWGRANEWGEASDLLAFCLEAHSDFTAGNEIQSWAWLSCSVEIEIRIQEAWGFWKMWSKILERRELSRKELTNLHGASIKSSLNIILRQVCTGWNFTRLGKEWVGCYGLNGSQSSHRAENPPISIRQSGGFLLIIQGIQ